VAPGIKEEEEIVTSKGQAGPFRDQVEITTHPRLQSRPHEQVSSGDVSDDVSQGSFLQNARQLVAQPLWVFYTVLGAMPAVLGRHWGDMIHP
jgi:hypothetical protein